MLFITPTQWCFELLWLLKLFNGIRQHMILLIIQHSLIFSKNMFNTCHKQRWCNVNESTIVITFEITASWSIKINPNDNWFGIVSRNIENNKTNDRVVSSINNSQPKIMVWPSWFTLTNGANIIKYLFRL